MNPKISLHKLLVVSVFYILSHVSVHAQSETSIFKAQLALGVSNPSSNGFVQNFEGKSLNFPTVNLGFQYMFLKHLGGKLDYGFSRISNENDTPAFKLNYSRVNLQLVYDASRIMIFSNRIGAFVHAGPGYSFVKPLGNFTNNEVSFFNVMGGVELHYGISDSVTVFLDSAYILGMGKDFNPPTSGFGAFNGDVLTVTFGVSLSLSGCYFCND
jgi:hypothetical protein